MANLAQPPRAGHSRYLEFDALRGLAALVVMLSHYFPQLHRYSGVPLLVPMDYGYYAVKLFFAISGFVSFLTLDYCKSVAEFALLRFSRIYPAYWASLLFVTAVGTVVFSEPFWLGGLVTNSTMLQEFFGFPHMDIVYWSLTVELAFYFNAAWLFALGLHRKPLLVTTVWLAASAIWALTFYEYFPDRRSGWPALLFVLDYSPYFCMGIVFFDAQKHGWSAARIVLIGFALVTETLLFSLEGLAVSSCILAIMLLATTGHIKVLLNPVALWLGAVSYSLYLVHRDLGFMSLRWLREHGAGGTFSFVVVVAGALVLAFALTYGVERPCMRLIRRKYAVGRFTESRA